MGKGGKSGIAAATLDKSLLLLLELEEALLPLSLVVLAVAGMGGEWLEGPIFGSNSVVVLTGDDRVLLLVVFPFCK